MSIPPANENQTLIHSPPVTGQTLVGASSRSSQTLPPGTRLGEFEVVSLIGEGGFGIVYLAFDHSLERNVAVKEYMPSSLASRTSGAFTVTVKSELHAETFRAGLRSFINEARLLAQFDHPALLKVHRFWEANGTAYMAMPFYEGPTLKAALKEMGSPPNEAWLKQLLDPLLDALSVLHNANCFHRDIAPDNILLTATGPVLLDFGAARRVIGEANQGLTVILKPGYAPIEQYGETATIGQGPWTDVYALACVIYAAISGRTPIASIERLMDDRPQPLSQLAANKYDINFLQAIDIALSIKPQDRPPNIARFRALLNIDDPHGSSVAVTSKTRPRTISGSEIERRAASSRSSSVVRSSKQTWYAVSIAVLALATATIVWILWPRDVATQPTVTSTPASTSAPILIPTPLPVVSAPPAELPTPTPEAKLADIPRVSDTPAATAQTNHQTPVVASKEQTVPKNTSPPHLTATNPKPPPVTISLGQSIDTVISLLGNPTRTVNLGPKKIYLYSDMKITFQNNRVSDVRLYQKIPATNSSNNYRGTSR